MPPDARASLAIVYRWDFRDPKRRSSWRRLSWMVSEENAVEWVNAEDVKLRKVERSCEERRNLKGFVPTRAETPLHFYPKPKPKE